MSCPNCGAELRDGAKFCSECGTPAGIACPSCSSPVTPNDKFCAECGTQLGAPAGQAAPVPAPPSSSLRTEERRFVTVMFTDLVGFTPLTQEHDSEDVRRMLTAYFDRARQIVARFDGVLDKFIGDAVMAVWGADVSHEDDAERAVRAALDLVEAVADLGRELGLPDLRARAGVLSGEAAVGGDGNESTGLIVGEIVNTASRLQGSAEPGTVLVGEATKELAQRAIEFVAAGTLELKGIAQPVDAFRAVRIAGGHGGTRRAAGLEPPFVGRTDELRMLKDALHACGRDGRSRMVSIVGQGGIGKSRLVEEFWKYVDGLPEITYWHQGRSPAYGDGLSFWALAEMIRQRCGIAETDDDHRSRTRLRTTLAEFVADADDRDWAESRLEGLLGLAEVPPGDRAELFAAWRLLFAELAKRHTTVMVFEDLHWADDGLLDFVDELVTSLVDQPILVLTLARPELLDRRPGWGSGRTSTMSAHLAPLADQTMRELVDGVVTDAPYELVDSIVERAGGIPLYGVEFLRMLHAQGQLEAIGDGRHRFAGDPGALEIPDSLHGLVGSRLDQLDPQDRALVQDAAILGQSFTLRGLQALRGETVDDLQSALEPLVRREILAVNRDPRSPERGQYRFVQSVIREVAHQRIPKAERFARHVDVARHFESLEDPELVQIVASHLLEALEVAPPDRVEELRTSAVDGLLAAADRADALQSPRQVLRLCERGLELTEDPRLRGEILVRAARAAHGAVDERAERLARDALETFRKAEDRSGILRAATTLAWMLNGEGRANESWPLLLDAVGSDPGGTAADAHAMAELGRSYMLDRKDREGLEWLERALPVAERLEMIPVVVDAMITKGTSLAANERPIEGMALLEASLQLARDHQLLRAKRRVLQNLDFVGSADRVLRPDLAAERLEDAKRSGDRRLLNEVTLENAWRAVWQLDPDAVESTLSEMAHEVLSPPAEEAMENLEAMLATLRGDAERFHRLAAGRLESDQQRGDTQTVANQQIDVTNGLYFAGRYEESFEMASNLSLQAPIRLDLLFMLWSSLRMKDPDRLRKVVEAAASSRYRGRSITLARRAAEGTLAALEGRRSEAIEAWTESLELAEDVWPRFHRTFMKAEAASALGTETEPGASWAAEAYRALHAAGYHRVIEMVPDGLVVDETAVGAG